MDRKILIADDEPNILLSLEYLMQRAGYTVTTAKNGQEVLDTIQADPPDLILLDVMMPVMNGLEVCQTIRANPKWRGIKVVLLTAKGRDVDREKGMGMGADDYITKPFATKDVVAMVKELLE